MGAKHKWWLMKGTCGDMLLRHIEGTGGYRKIDASRNWKFCRKAGPFAAENESVEA